MVVIRGARAAIHSELNIPARRDFFLLCSRLSPQAKDWYCNCPLCGQALFLFRKNKSAGLLQGKTACFPLWRLLAQARGPRQSPFSARICALPLDSFNGCQSRRASRDWLRFKFYSDQTQILFSRSKSLGSRRKKNLVGLQGENPVSPLFR